MDNFSESWRHLKSILAGYATRDHRPVGYSYEEQRHAKALATFLAHAKLATPVLDREIVGAVLAGTYQWPRSSGVPFAGTDIPLSQIEKWGLVSFYAGWCSIHCDSVRDLSTVDPSLVQLIEAIDHLKDIRYGRNDCIRPHYSSSEAEIRKQLSVEFGDHLTVEHLLPELELQDEVFSLPPGNQNFDSLISSHLWLTLRSTQSPEEAFSSWMMCFNVNCEWAMPVIFEASQYEERNEFNTQLLRFLTDDAELALDIAFYIRQSINEERFSHYIRPVKLHQKIVFDDQGSSASSTQAEELPKPTLSSLENIYPAEVYDASNDLEFVVNFQRSRMHGRRELFYSWLLSSVIDTSIRIEGQHLTSSDFIDEVMRLADTRPILKYILLVVLPTYEHTNYMVLLLARSATCDIALYYLAKQNFEHYRAPSTSYIKNLQEGYQQLVCYEYVRSIKKEQDSSTRLLSLIGVLGGQCNFRTSDFSKGLEYRLLLNLLDAIEHQQIVKLAQAFAELPIRIEDSLYEQSRQHYKYFLGFWLIEKLETSGIDPTGAKCRALRESIHKYYDAELSANLKGFRSLSASAFFATLPWGKLIVETGPNSLLILSNRCDEWRQELSYDSPHPFDVASAVRQYLQVLMCLGKPSSLAGPLHGVTTRVQEIVRSCGFGPREKFVNLFAELPGSEQYDLWEQFCSYSNAFRDDLYDEFVARCVPSIPLDSLFVLMKKCTVIARARLLHEAIDVRQSYTNDDLGLTGLEQAFTAACDSGRTETATRLLDSAKEILTQERFANAKSPGIIRIRKIWQSYEYKWQLLELYDAHKSDPTTFQTLAHEISIPHDGKGSMQSPDRAHYEDCEHFRRQIVAMAFIDIDPTKSIRIMETLYRETQRSHHGFVLFYGELKLYAVDKDKTRLQNALAYFLSGAGGIEPEQMSETWVATIMDAYRLINAPEIDSFWMRLSAEQQTQLQILTPYCSALIARGDSFTARKVLARYQGLNQSTPDDLGIDDLISELTKVEADQPSMKDLVQLLNEGSQRTILQLQKHYAQVISKDFETYVEIVKPDQPPHEYLKDAVLAVARELVLRKRNLQIESNTEKGDVCYRIMLEDWINDWFTSLFDQRMSQSRVGFRDQKRGGHSASGKNPGEIDGFITSNDNTRIAIFEAFRLSSLDTTVVKLHLNKIAGYDAESLSPVFIVGYCDVSNFPELVAWYGSYVSGQEYVGYTVAEDSIGKVNTLEHTDHIWLGTETRRRDRKDIVFYHTLINLHFSPPPATTKEGEPSESSLDLQALGGSTTACISQRRQRQIKVYKNPETGEIVKTKSGNHKVLKAWKELYGAEKVKAWQQ